MAVKVLKICYWIICVFSIFYFGVNFLIHSSEHNEGLAFLWVYIIAFHIITCTALSLEYALGTDVDRKSKIKPIILNAAVSLILFITVPMYFLLIRLLF